LAALAGSLALAAPATAELPGDPLISVQPVASALGDVNSASIVDGPFQMVVQVENGGTSDITLTPNLPSWSYFPTAPAQTVPGGTCAVTCQVTWQIDPASEATPWYEGFRNLGVTAVMDDRSLTTYGTGVYYRPTVRSTWSGIVADPTANTPGFGAGMVDTGGTVTFSGMPGRSPGEQVVVSVLPPAVNTDSSSHEYGMAALATATGTWQSDPDAATGYARGTTHLDTSTIPEGLYRLVAQAHDANGQYSYSTPTDLVVRHSPLLRIEPGGTGQVATGRDIGVTILVGSPRSTTAKLGDIKLTIGGATTRLGTSVIDWYVPHTWGQPSQRMVTIHTAGMPLGPTPVGVEVLDVNGASVASGTTSIDIVDFQDVVTIPTLVVGTTATVHLKATAPAGTTMLQCQFILFGPVVNEGSYDVCPGDYATSVDASTTLHPQDAGPAVVREDIIANDNVPGPQRDFPVTVYANRTATFTAPSKASHNTTQAATVTVKDEKKVGTRTAAAGVSVTLQRKKAGTTTWVTIGSGTTGSGGVATVKYTNTATGRLRAVVKGAVPNSTVITAERSVTSVATVAWSSLPTSVRSGYTVTAAVYAKPYEKGATVRLQARKHGATTWTTYGSGTVGTSGYARATARLYSRGTWEVRIQRVGTTTQATGYSSTRRIKVY
jgi:hypothetical protein